MYEAHIITWMQWIQRSLFLPVRQREARDRFYQWTDELSTTEVERLTYLLNQVSHT